MGKPSKKPKAADSLNSEGENEYESKFTVLLDREVAELLREAVKITRETKQDFVSCAIFQFADSVVQRQRHRDKMAGLRIKDDEET